MRECGANCIYAKGGKCALNRCAHVSLFEVFAKERIRMLWGLH